MRGVMLGGQTVLLCFAAAAAVVFSVALLQAGKEFESALAHGQDAGRVELVGRRPPAAGGRQQRAARGARGRWQDLAVWGGQTEKDPEFDTDIAYHKPKWLEQAGSIARGDPVPFSVNRPDAVIPSEAGEDEDGELEETRALRKKLQDAERELEDAHKQLERAEGGANGKSDQVAGQQVGHFADMQVVQDQGPEIKFSKTLLSNGETVRIEWSGVDTVSKMDFIALYTPPDADNHDCAYQTTQMHSFACTHTHLRARTHSHSHGHACATGWGVRWSRCGCLHSTSCARQILTGKRYVHVHAHTCRARVRAHVCRPGDAQRDRKQHLDDGARLHQREALQPPQGGRLRSALLSQRRFSQ